MAGMRDRGASWKSISAVQLPGTEWAGLDPSTTGCGGRRRHEALAGLRPRGQDNGIGEKRMCIVWPCAGLLRRMEDLRQFQTNHTHARNPVQEWLKKCFPAFWVRPPASTLPDVGKSAVWWRHPPDMAFSQSGSGSIWQAWPCPFRTGFEGFAGQI
jgi:hypothetical protein